MLDQVKKDDPKFLTVTAKQLEFLRDCLSKVTAPRAFGRALEDLADQVDELIGAAKK